MRFSGKAEVLVGWKENKSEGKVGVASSAERRPMVLRCCLPSYCS